MQILHLLMFTQLATARSPAILSVRVRSVRRHMALVITPSPSIARIVGDYLRERDGNLTVVWMRTVEAACNRLEWQHADTVVIDAAIPESREAINTLHLADPTAEVQVLASGT